MTLDASTCKAHDEPARTRPDTHTDRTQAVLSTRTNRRNGPSTAPRAGPSAPEAPKAADAGRASPRRRRPRRRPAAAARRPPLRQRCHRWVGGSWWEEGGAARPAGERPISHSGRWLEAAAGAPRPPGRAPPHATRRLRQPGRPLERRSSRGRAGWSAGCCAPSSARAAPPAPS